ncbi:hypothetical protein [Actinomadura litoris]|uniref:hypothetical protein n=1 Tax=Actinomadura litoris TaxID=2678616 RepID=UPI001FA6F47F|nr:hypothetical protein [Actinomadura litoris]
MQDWDAPACEHCGGTRRVVLEGRRGWIEVNCWYCQGTGNEGGQPSDVEPPDLSAPRPPVGQHVAVAESGLCPVCLGAREVVSLADGMRGRAPCPRCA